MHSAFRKVRFQNPQGCNRSLMRSAAQIKLASPTCLSVSEFRPKSSRSPVHSSIAFWLLDNSAQ